MRIARLGQLGRVCCGLPVEVNLGAVFELDLHSLDK